MVRIFKYELDFAVMQVVTAPINKVLSVQIQDNKLVMWAEVFAVGPNKQVQVVLVGTGGAIPSYAGEYLNTLQVNGFVWHIYIKGV